MLECEQNRNHMKKIFTATGLFLLSILFLGFFKKDDNSEPPTSDEHSTDDWTGEAISDWGI